MKCNGFYNFKSRFLPLKITFFSGLTYDVFTIPLFRLFVTDCIIIGLFVKGGTGLFSICQFWVLPIASHSIFHACTLIYQANCYPSRNESPLRTPPRKTKDHLLSSSSSVLFHEEEQREETYIPRSVSLPDHVTQVVHWVINYIRPCMYTVPLRIACVLCVGLCQQFINIK